MLALEGFNRNVTNGFFEFEDDASQTLIASHFLCIAEPICALNPNYANGFLSIRVMIVSSITLGTFLMHRIRNVLTNRVLK